MAEDSRVAAARDYAAGMAAAGDQAEAEVVLALVAAYEERLRVNVGLLADNTELKKQVGWAQLQASSKPERSPSVEGRYEVDVLPLRR